MSAPGSSPSKNKWNLGLFEKHLHGHAALPKPAGRWSHAMKFFAAKNGNEAFIIKRSAEFQASAKKKHIFSLHLWGIPDTELCTGKKRKTSGDFPTWDLSPFFEGNVGQKEISLPFFHVDLGHLWSRSFAILWMSWKTQIYISHEEAVLNDSSCAHRHTANCWFCHANPVFSFSSSCQMPLRW